MGWMTTFDEDARIELYSEGHLDWLAATGASLRRTSRSRPGGDHESAFALAFRRDPIARAMVSDLVTYLPGDLLVKVDMASMAHSLECRGPFLDHRVVELAVAMPTNRKIRIAPGPIQSRSQAGVFGAVAACDQDSLQDGFRRAD